jgi:hypothetical protein
VLDVEPVLVICHLEVRTSLAEANVFPKLLSAALWERYLPCALTAAEGRPVLLSGIPICSPILLLRSAVAADEAAARAGQTAGGRPSRKLDEARDRVDKYRKSSKPNEAAVARSGKAAARRIRRAA